MKLLEQGVRKAIQDVAITPSGKMFFHWFMHECGFHATSIVQKEDKSIDSDGMLINEALRRFYINIRKHIPPHILPDIEYLDVDKFVIEELKIEKGEK